MSKRHGGRTLYLNPDKSAIEAELDELFRSTDRVQSLLRGFVVAGYALSKEGIGWDSAKGCLAQGKDAVSWTRQTDAGAASSVVVDEAQHQPGPSPKTDPAGVNAEAARGAVASDAQPVNEAVPAAQETVVQASGQPVKKKFSAFLKGA